MWGWREDRALKMGKAGHRCYEREKGNGRTFLGNEVNERKGRESSRVEGCITQKKL